MEVVIVGFLKEKRKERMKERKKRGVWKPFCIRSFFVDKIF